MRRAGGAGVGVGEAVVVAGLVGVGALDRRPRLDDQRAAAGEAVADRALADDPAARARGRARTAPAGRTRRRVDARELPLGLLDHGPEVVAEAAVGGGDRGVVVRDRRRDADAADRAVRLALPVRADGASRGPAAPCRPGRGRPCCRCAATNCWCVVGVTAGSGSVRVGVPDDAQGQRAAVHQPERRAPGGRRRVERRAGPDGGAAGRQAGDDRVGQREPRGDAGDRACAGERAADRHQVAVRQRDGVRRAGPGPSGWADQQGAVDLDRRGAGRLRGAGRGRRTDRRRP